MSETATAVIDAVTSKEGATNGRAWRKYTVKTETGDFYSTFDSALAERVHALTGQRVSLTYKTSGDQGQFRDVLAVAPVEGSAAATNGHGADASAIPTARTEQGSADWDVIGLRKTRCLLWAEYLNGVAPLLTDPSTVVDTVYRKGVELVTKAEVDIYWREPAAKEDDLPF